MTDPLENPSVFKIIQTQEINAKRFGFYWQHLEQLLQQIRSECDEVEESWHKNDKVHLQEEVGDLIHATVSLAIFCHLDPEETLLKSIQKFQKRYDALVKYAKEDGLENLDNQPQHILQHYWDRAKQT